MEIMKKFKLGTVITEEQKSFYEKNGFVVFENVFDEERISQIIKELDLQRILIAKSGKKMINGVPIKFGADETGVVIPQRIPFMNIFSSLINELVRDPIFNPLLEFIPNSRFGLEERDGVVMNHYVTTAKSRLKKLGWHVDSSRDPFYLEKIRPMLNVGIHVSPSSKRDGGLVLVPGTHHQSPWKMFTAKLHHLSSKPDPNEIAVEVSPGDVTIHDGRLWHRANAATEKLAYHRKTIYFPILCGPYVPKDENSKMPFLLRLIVG